MKISIRDHCVGCPGCGGTICKIADRKLGKRELYFHLPDWCPLPDDFGDVKIGRRLSEVEKAIASLKGAVASFRSALTKARKAIKLLGE